MMFGRPDQHSPNISDSVFVNSVAHLGGCMSSVSANADNKMTSVSRPMVKALFVASCLLAIVSWYTTQQGMALYLSPWFAVLASLGVQTALVLVAWLVGISRTKRTLLVAVYAVTAVVSIAFSYA